MIFHMSVKIFVAGPLPLTCKRKHESEHITNHAHKTKEHKVHFSGTIFTNNIQKFQGQSAFCLFSVDTTKVGTKRIVKTTMYSQNLLTEPKLPQRRSSQLPLDSLRIVAESA